ncbi:MAG: GlsB/YeaQ/YmgE family stress response membrane protein [Gemmatimonadaceae bacterium]
MVGSLGIGGGGVIWSILVATLGAVILVWLVRLVSGGTRARA